MTHTYTRRFSLPTIAAFICIILLAVWALISTLFSPYERRIFIFPNLQTGNLEFETRFLDQRYLAQTGNKTDSAVVQFVEELLLGPIEVTSRRLFPKTTAILSCFVKDTTLYIHLSEEALSNKTNSADVETAYNVFKKNVFTNFANIDIIRMYINNKEAYVPASLEK